MPEDGATLTLLTMRPELVKWQWQNYPDNHRDGRNLLIHILTVPLFMGGTVALLVAPWLSLWLVAAGPAAMAAAMALQGRGHQRETTPPIPFAGPLDVVARIFVEQWITFPRFVAAGAWSAAWRARRVP
jgi:hypothetical protein